MNTPADKIRPIEVKPSRALCYVAVTADTLPSTYFTVSIVGPPNNRVIFVRHFATHESALEVYEGLLRKQPFDPEHPPC